MNKQKVAKATALLLSAVSVVSAAAPMASVGVFAESATTVQTNMNKATLKAVANKKDVTTMPKDEIFSLTTGGIKGNFKYTYSVKKPGVTAYTPLETYTNKTSIDTSMTAYGAYVYKVTITNVDTGQVIEKEQTFTCAASFADGAAVTDAAGNTYKVLSAASKTLAITGVAKGKNGNGYDFEGTITLNNTTVNTKDAFPTVAGYTITQFGDGANPVTNISGTPYKSINIPSTVTTIASKAVDGNLVKVDVTNPGVIILGSTDITDLYSSHLTTIRSDAFTITTANIKGVIFRTYHANVYGSKETRNTTTLVSTPTVGYCGYTGQLPVGAVVEAPFGSWAFQCLETVSTTANVVSTQASKRDYVVNGTPGYDFTKGVVDKVSGKRMFWAISFANQLATATSVPAYQILCENAGNPDYYSGTNILIPYATAMKYIKRTVDFEYGDSYNQRRVDFIPREKSNLTGTQWFRLDVSFPLTSMVSFTELGLKDFAAAAFSNGRTTVTFPGLDRLYPVRYVNSKNGQGYISVTDVTVTSNSTNVPTTVYTGAGGDLVYTVTLPNKGIFETGSMTLYTHCSTQAEYSNIHTTSGNVVAKLVRCKWDTSKKMYISASDGGRVYLKFPANLTGAKAQHYYVITATNLVTGAKTVLWDGAAKKTRGLKLHTSAFGLNYDKNATLPFDFNTCYAITVSEYATYNAETQTCEGLIDETVSYPYISDGDTQRLWLGVESNQLDIDAPFEISTSDATVTGNNITVGKLRVTKDRVTESTTTFSYDLYRQVGNGKPTLIKQNQSFTENVTKQMLTATITDAGAIDFNTQVTWWVDLKMTKNGTVSHPVCKTWIKDAAQRNVKVVKVTGNSATESTEKLYKLASYKPKGLELAASTETVDAGGRVKLTIKSHDKTFTDSYIDLSSAKVQYRASATASWTDLTKDVNNKGIDFVDSNACYVSPTANGILEYRVVYKYHDSDTWYSSNSVVVSTGIVTTLTNTSAVSTMGRSNRDMESRTGFVIYSANVAGTSGDFFSAVQRKSTNTDNYADVILDETGTTKLTLRNKIATSPIDAWVKSKASNVAPTGRAVATQYFTVYKLTVDGNKKVTAISELPANDPIRNSMVDGKLSNGKSVVYDYNSASVTLNVKANPGYYLLVSHADVKNPVNPVTAGVYTELTANRCYLLNISKGAYLANTKVSVSDGATISNSNVVGASQHLIVDVKGFEDTVQTAYESQGFKKDSKKSQAYYLDLANTTPAQQTSKIAAMRNVFQPVVTLKVDVPGAGAKLVKLTTDTTYTKDFTGTLNGKAEPSTTGTTNFYRYVATNQDVITGVQFVFTSNTIQNILRSAGSTMQPGDTVNGELTIWSKSTGTTDIYKKVNVTLTKGNS